MSSATSSSHFWYRGGRSAIFGGAAGAAARIGAKTRKKRRSGRDRRYDIGGDPTLSKSEVRRLRVGAGLDGGVGARPALGVFGRCRQGGSSPRPAVQTRPYPKQDSRLHG